VHLSVLVPDNDLDAILPFWHANLVVGDLREAMHTADPSRPLFGEAVTLVSSTGKIVNTINTNIGDIAYDQRFSDASQSVLSAAIHEGAAAAGVVVKSIAVFNGLDPAPAVVVSTSDPKAYMANADLNEEKIFRDSTTYEGIYLEVQDAAGDPFLISSSSFRTGIGQTWVRADLNRSMDPTDDGGPLPQSGPPPNG
jgi:hypothetical protein